MMVKEIYRDSVEEFKVKLEASTIASTRKKKIERSAVRIYSDGKIGIAGAIGKANLNDLEKKAIEKLKFDLTYEARPTEGIYEHMKLRCAFDDPESLQREFEYITAQLKKSHPNFLYNGHADFEKVDVILENEAGLGLSHTHTAYRMVFLLKKKDSANMLDGYLWSEGLRYSRDRVMETFEEILTALENEAPLPNKKKMRVLFLVSDGQPLWIFYRDLNALRFGCGGSLFSGKLGQKLFTDKFTLIQTRNSDDGFIGTFFDMEGTVVEDLRYPLIKEGKLITPYTSKKYAARYGYDLTGAAGGDFDSVPDVTFPRLTVKPTHNKIEEIAGDEAIFVLVGGGGDFTPEGNFSLPVQIPLLYKNGSFVGKLPPVRIRSNVWKMFDEDFVGVSEKPLMFTDESSRILAIDMEVSEEI